MRGMETTTGDFKEPFGICVDTNDDEEARWASILKMIYIYGAQNTRAGLR